MMNTKLNHKKILFFFMLFFMILFFIAYSDNIGKPLVLQEMSWQDVKDYLKSCDMVIIPTGSTEQHGPHLPLGTDFYEATEISKRISAGGNRRVFAWATIASANGWLRRYRWASPERRGNS